MDLIRNHVTQPSTTTKMLQHKVGAIPCGVSHHERREQTSGQAMSLVQHSRFGQICNRKAGPHGAIAKICVFNVSEVTVIHEANAVENIVANQNAAGWSVLHRSHLIELSNICFSISVMESGVRPASIEPTTGTPNLALIVMEHDLRRGHVAAGPVDACDQGLQQFRVELGVV